MREAKETLQHLTSRLSIAELRQLWDALAADDTYWFLMDAIKEHINKQTPPTGDDSNPTTSIQTEGERSG